jgi:hypothetical protein
MAKTQAQRNAERAAAERETAAADARNSPEPVEPPRIEDVPAELIVGQTWSARYVGSAHRRVLSESDMIKLGVPSELAESLDVARGALAEVHSQEMFDALVTMPDWKSS